jgi:ketosteroid isomerase-like protein
MPAVQVSALAAAAALVCASCALPPPATRAARTTPQAVVDELLAADRAFTAASAKTDVVTGVAAMFADDIIMAVPGSRFAEGKPAAVAALHANADNARSRIEWAPIRGGVSADGQHGFTFGYMTLHRPDGSTAALKYLSYWIRQADGWRVAAYRRRPAPHAARAPIMMPPALPVRLVPVSTDPAALARHRDSLEQAERAFSRAAQSIGLGAAFARYGSADAINMGGSDRPDFIVGAAAIGRAVGTGTPADSSPVSWAPDRVIVASSGDLGITFGMIRSNAPQPPGSAAPGTPFFTIWRRTDVSQPWRYIAE